MCKSSRYTATPLFLRVSVPYSSGAVQELKHQMEIRWRYSPLWRGNGKKVPRLRFHFRLVVGLGEVQLRKVFPSG